MTKADYCRNNAAATVDLVNRAATSADKIRLLSLAEKWLDLADKAHCRQRGGSQGPQQNPAMWLGPRDSDYRRGS